MTSELEGLAVAATLVFSHVLGAFARLDPTFGVLVICVLRFYTLLLPCYSLGDSFLYAVTVTSFLCLACASN